jgi:hypothetical protein
MKNLFQKFAAQFNENNFFFFHRKIVFYHLPHPLAPTNVDVVFLTDLQLPLTKTLKILEINKNVKKNKKSFSAKFIEKCLSFFYIFIDF